MPVPKLPKIKRITAFPMQVGERRNFCSAMIRGKSGSQQVGGDLIEAWAVTLVEFAFGGGLQVRQKAYDYPYPLLIGEHVEASLLLVRVRKVPGQPLNFMWFEVEVTTKKLPVLVGKATVVVPI